MDAFPKDVLWMVFRTACCVSGDVRDRMFCWCVQVRFIRSVCRKWRAACIAAPDAYFLRLKDCSLQKACFSSSSIKNTIRRLWTSEERTQAMLTVLLHWNYPIGGMLDAAIETNSRWVTQEAVKRNVTAIPGMFNRIISNNSNESMAAVQQMILVYDNKQREKFIIHAYNSGSVSVLEIIVATITGHPYGIGMAGSPIQHFPPPKKATINVTVDYANASPLYDRGREYMSQLPRDVVQRYIMELVMRGWPRHAIGIIESTGVYSTAVCEWCKGNSKGWPRAARKAFHERIMKMEVCSCKTKKRKT